MCGIVGYIGKDEALPILVAGLKNLEYRGYDSAGIAVSQDGTTKTVKAVGKIADLERVLGEREEMLCGTAGIAHTRWATHGGVTEANAHPQSDCVGVIQLVHNGIIENYRDIKERIAWRHRFVSDTDTEVLAHLIEEKREGGVALPDAVRAALKEVRGTYGIALLDAREPDMLIAARNFSPLLIGLGEGEMLIASDASAVLARTRNVLYLKNGDIAVITSRGHCITTIDNAPVTRVPETLHERDAVLAKKGGYSHFMLKEINEGPDAIRNTLRGRLVAGRGEAILGGLKEKGDILRHARRIIVCACGSAYGAAHVGRYMLEEYAGIPVQLEYASEFRYRKPLFQEGDVFLAVSQSGETIDTLASMYEAKEKGIPTFSIVNVVGSTISRETDAGIYQHIGPEIGVAATKSFVSQTAAMTLLTLFMGRMRGLSLVMGRRIAEELERIPEHMETVLKRAQEIEHIARAYKDMQSAFFIGRKYNAPIATEGALKLKEVSYVHAEGYSAGEMKHGPIALIDARFPTFAIAPKDSVYEKMLSNISEIKARGGPVIAIATEGDVKIAALVDHVVYIPKTLEMLTPLLSVIPLQLLAYYVGVARGLDVDKPRNLAKSVTVE